MEFHSSEFLVFFLPVAYFGYAALAQKSMTRAAKAWVIGVSLVFYIHGEPNLFSILLLSITLNYWLGRNIRVKPSSVSLLFGVAANLLPLLYFKYFPETLGMIGGRSPVLPLAISFYTFKQIAYLVQSNNGEIKDTGFLNYCLFITFFPQLISGPLIDHNGFVAQLNEQKSSKLDGLPLSLGISAFATGLFKKVVLADSFAPIAGNMFDVAAGGTIPTVLHAWIGSIAYALQLYFDFSGYSDMAIGLALFFGIALPINFASPYKARSIIEFWSRWHITLTKYLTRYIYTPITISLSRRRAKVQKSVLRTSNPEIGAFLVLIAGPTLITMTVAGAWHGSGWQFILFGVWHGVLLIINHAFLMYCPMRSRNDTIAPVTRAAAVLTTFLLVVIGLVIFRSENLSHMYTVLCGLAGLHVPGPSRPVTSPFDVIYDGQIARMDVGLIALGLSIVWLLPNTQTWLGLNGANKKSPAFWQFERAAVLWRPNTAHGFLIGMMLSVVFLQVVGGSPKEFQYFKY